MARPLRTDDGAIIGAIETFTPLEEPADAEALDLPPHCEERDVDARERLSASFDIET